MGLVKLLRRDVVLGLEVPDWLPPAGDIAQDDGLVCVQGGPIEALQEVVEAGKLDEDVVVDFEQIFSAVTKSENIIIIVTDTPKLMELMKDGRKNNKSAPTNEL